MKTCNFLFTACLASLSLVIGANAPVVAQASSKHDASPVKEQHQKPPSYEMVKRSVIGTDNVLGEQVWDVRVAAMIPPQVAVNPQPPDYLFKSLDAPPLLAWVNSLPSKSEICLSIFTGPRIKFAGPSGSGEVPVKLQQEIDAFGRFCANHNVNVVEAIASG